MDKERRALLDSQPWDEYLERLTAYAQRELKRWRFRGEWGGPVAGAAAEDFAAMVIVDVYSGTRNWDPAKDPVLLKYLFDAIDSELYAACRRLENRRESLAGDLPDGSVPEGVHEDPDETFFWDVIDELDGEPDLQRVVELTRYGYKRADIAKEMGLTPEDITNLQKRLFRRMADFRERTPLAQTARRTNVER